MTSTAVGISEELTRIANQSAQSSLNSSKESEKLKQQSLDDALWRMAQNNAMAKIKGFSKLAEAANQMGS